MHVELVQQRAQDSSRLENYGRCSKNLFACAGLGACSITPLCARSLICESSIMDNDRLERVDKTMSGAIKPASGKAQDASEMRATSDGQGITSGDALSVQEQHDPAAETLVLPLHTEELVVARRQVERSVVRVATATRLVDKLVEEDLVQERVECERVPIGRYVDSFPPVREEGDVTIMPVVEEVLVVERKYLLKEEVHIRRTRTTVRHSETVPLRMQEAIVTRTATPTPGHDPIPDARSKDQTS